MLDDEFLVSAIHLLSVEPAGSRSGRVSGLGPGAIIRNNIQQVFFMSDNQSLVCRGLPRGLWWLLALLGLALLYILMLNAREGVIESDLQGRAARALSSAGIDWAKVDLARRGRDVLLTGVAPSERERDRAIGLARHVAGVRIVESQVDIATPLASPSLMIEYQQDRVVLQGRLASRAAVDQVVSAANSAWGEGKVDNRLTVSDQVGEAAWISAAVGMMPGMAEMNAANLMLSDSGSTLTGEAASEEQRQSLMGGARDMLGEAFQADIAVAALPEPEPAIAEVEEQTPAETAASSSGEEAPPGEASSSEEEASPAEAVASSAAREAASAESEAPSSEDVAPSSRTADPVKLCQDKLDGVMKDHKVLFAYNRAELRPESQALLDRMAAALKACGDALKNGALVIAGHTDSRGDDAYNQALSQRRADAVKDYLVGAGVDAALIRSVGKGESEPVASNDTEEGMARNRRITFTIQQTQAE